MPQDYTLDAFRSHLADARRAEQTDRIDHLLRPPETDPAAALDRDIGIIDAMTGAERADPDRIDAAARGRIAAAAGTEPAEVAGLLDRFAQVRGLVRQVANRTFWQRLKVVLGFGRLPPADPNDPGG